MKTPPSDASSQYPNVVRWGIGGAVPTRLMVTVSDPGTATVAPPSGLLSMTEKDVPVVPAGVGGASVLIGTVMLAGVDAGAPCSEGAGGGARASRVGANLTLLGSIAPSHAHERVSLEQLRGRRWATIARPKLGAHASFAVRRSLLGHSVERFRVVVAADAHNSRSVSPVLVIPVS